MHAAADDLTDWESVSLVHCHVLSIVTYIVGLCGLSREKTAGELLPKLTVVRNSALTMVLPFCSISSRNDWYITARTR